MCDCPKHQDDAAPVRLTDTDRIEEILAEHAYKPSGLRGVSSCACGEQFYGFPQHHRAHLAEQITARSTEAPGLAERVAALADEFGKDKERAAAWAAQTSENFREAMSRKVAWESAEKSLRALLDPTDQSGGA